MLLAVDIGNTQIALGLVESEWLVCWRLETDARRTADEYGVVIAELFALERRALAEVDHVILSSVVPALTPVFVAALERLVGRRPFVVRSGVRTGMEVRYEPPSALGTDRLVDAVAAKARFGPPVIVVDFGTATTFNVVGPDGAFVGGAIAPGVGIAVDALAEAGARLHRIDLAAPDGLPVVGRSTVDGMRSGALYGYAGLVEGLVDRFDAELGSKPPVVATGGMSRIVAPMVARITEVDPDLTLEGLRLIHQLNLDADG